MRKGNSPLITVISLMVFTLACPSVRASTELAKQIQISATATDNIRLDQSGSETDLITELVPSFSLTRYRNRSTFAINGEVELEHFQRTGTTRVSPKFSATGVRRTSQELLTFDGAAFVNQTSLSSRLDGTDGITNASSLSRVYGSTLGLRISPDLGRAFEVGARVSGTVNFADDDANTESGSFTTVASFVHRTPFGGFYYGMNGTYLAREQHADGNIAASDENRLNTADVVIGVTRLTLGYVFSQSIAASASFGESFINDRLADSRTSDDAWQVALSWSPNRRTSVVAGFSRTFSSSAPSLSVNYRLRNALVSLGWSRAVSLESTAFSDSLQVSGSGSGSNLQFGSSIEELGETDLPDVINNQFIEPTAFAAETASARLALVGRRTRVSIFTVYSRSENRDDEFIFDNWSVGSSVFRPARKGLSFRFDITWRGQSNVLGEPEFAENRLGITISKQF